MQVDQTTIARIIGILALAYVAYQWWNIPGVIMVVGFALCNKI